MTNDEILTKLNIAYKEIAEVTRAIKKDKNKDLIAAANAILYELGVVHTTFVHRHADG